MGLFDSLVDPTREWPAVPGAAPNVNRVLMQIESLHFGASIDSARILGRPDRFRWTSRMSKNCELLYAKKGLRLRFENGGLIEVAFLIGKRSCDHPEFVAAKPLAPDGTPMTPEIDPNRVTALFGPPDPGGSDATCLQVFHGEHIASDFNFDEQGLNEWSLYSLD